MRLDSLRDHQRTCLISIRSPLLLLHGACHCLWTIQRQMIFSITLTLVETELAMQEDLFLLVVAWEIWDVCLFWYLDS